MIVSSAALLLTACCLLLSLAPDTLSMLILIVMFFVVVLGFFLGLMPSILYGNGFRNARNNIGQALDVQSTETWIAVFKMDILFRQKDLDNMFKEYKNHVERQKEEGEIVSDVEDYISEDVLSSSRFRVFLQDLVSLVPLSV